MTLLPFENLPVHKSRRFVPEEINLGDWAQISPLFDQLETRAPQCSTLTDLENWLVDWSELSAVLDRDSVAVLLEDMFELFGLGKTFLNDKDFYFFAHITPCNVRKFALPGSTGRPSHPAGNVEHEEV